MNTIAAALAGHGPTARERASSTILYLSRSQVESAGPTLAELIDAIELAYLERARGSIESPPKRGISPLPGASIRAMQAFVPSVGAVGVKWISAFPRNMALAMPTIHALVVLNDIETGTVTAMLDGAWITAQRTAASTAVACKHLARPDSSTIGIVACGLQGEMNLRAICQLFPITQALAYDIEYTHAQRFASRLAPELGIEIISARRLRQAVDGVDILVTSMPIEKQPTPPIASDWLAEGALVCLLDFDAAVADLSALDRFVTDDRTQLNFFKGIGYLRHTPDPDAELGDIVEAAHNGVSLMGVSLLGVSLLGGAPFGRAKAEDRIACMNLGIGFLDIVTAKMVCDRARAMGIGTQLER